MNQHRTLIFLFCLLWLTVPGFFVYAAEEPGLCKISLHSLSSESGTPGDILEMHGIWGETQGSKTPSINRGSANRLEVLSWSNSVIKVRIPEHLPDGVYKVGVYCNNPPYYQGSGWQDFKVRTKSTSQGKTELSVPITPAPKQKNTEPDIIPGGSSPDSETILSFHSDITIHRDSSMTVKETITVWSKGEKIKRGIYRDFPTTYKDIPGNRYTVGFRVTGVFKNGKNEPYHEKGLSNGRRLYIGRKNTFLKPGKYIYTIIYETDRQLGFFKNHDELYWNVTGNGWEFPIEAASASVTLPEGSAEEVISSEAYTGFYGDKGKDYEVYRDAGGIVRFITTRPLDPKEGLTIVVTWPKGYVQQPGVEQKARYFLRDHGGKAVSVIGLILVLTYYLSAWFMTGRDPDAGIIVTRYTPPEGITPAVMRYITRMSYDDRTLTASIINMAVKGHITIKENDGRFTLRLKEGGSQPLSEEERQIMGNLLGGGDKISLEKTNHKKIRSTIKAYRDYLALKYEKIYFITNRRYFLFGIGLTIAILFSSGLWESISKGRLPFFLFISIWLSIWTVGVLGLVNQMVVKWRHAIRGRGVSLLKAGSALFITVFTIPFIAGEIAGISILGYSTSITMVLFLLIAGLMNYTFYYLLKAPTRAGRRLLDAVEGFRVFLAATEADRLNMLNPPERTPELFELFLPYAFALGLEQHWAEQFSDILSSSKAGETGAYSPSWFSGTSLSSMTAGGFASALGDSFSSAVSSSSTAPGSSSGSSGGGSSGGGGGGGGGGGW